MHRSIALLVGAAALAGIAETATARDGCGRGYYWNGFSCAPQVYAPAPSYRVAPAPAYPQAYINRRGQAKCTAPGWTVQDGVCKPYRGY
jgi:hypothetical protein